MKGEAIPSGKQFVEYFSITSLRRVRGAEGVRPIERHALLHRDQCWLKSLSLDDHMASLRDFGV